MATNEEFLEIAKPLMAMSIPPDVTKANKIDIDFVAIAQKCVDRGSYLESVSIDRSIGGVARLNIALIFPITEPWESPAGLDKGLLK